MKGFGRLELVEASRNFEERKMYFLIPTKGFNAAQLQRIWLFQKRSNSLSINREHLACFTHVPCVILHPTMVEFVESKRHGRSSFEHDETFETELVSFGFFSCFCIKESLSFQTFRYLTDHFVVLCDACLELVHKYSFYKSRSSNPDIISKLVTINLHQ